MTWFHGPPNARKRATVDDLSIVVVGTDDGETIQIWRGIARNGRDTAYGFKVWSDKKELKNSGGCVLLP
jgi:hypothetical protein